MHSDKRKIRCENKRQRPQGRKRSCENNENKQKDNTTERKAGKTQVDKRIQQRLDSKGARKIWSDKAQTEQAEVKNIETWRSREEEEFRKMRFVASSAKKRKHDENIEAWLDTNMQSREENRKMSFAVS